MKSTAPASLTLFSHLLQTELFPFLESAVGPIGKQAKLLVSVVSLESLSKWVKRRRAQTGRPSSDRRCLASAFFPKQSAT